MAEGTVGSRTRELWLHLTDLAEKTLRGQGSQSLLVSCQRWFSERSVASSVVPGTCEEGVRCTKLETALQWPWRDIYQPAINFSDLWA